MKKIFTFSLLLISTIGFAQTSKKIQLTSGKKINITNISATVTDLGMGMQMNNNTTVTSNMVVTNENDNYYELNNTITRMQTNMDGMGQNISFDSDKKEDLDSEMGQGLAGTINKAEVLKINKANGKMEKIKADNDAKEGNPMMGMAGMGNSESESGPVFVLPSNIKVGESWNTENKEGTMTVKSTYTLKSLDNNTALVNMSGTVDGTMEQEQMGNTMNITINSKVTGDITFDVNSSLVSKRNMVTDVSGNIDMMGQQMPISAKTTSTITYSY
jgi:hypothetical protein